MEYDLSTDDEIYLTQNRKLLYMLCAKLDYYGMCRFLQQILYIIIVTKVTAISNYIFPASPSESIYIYTNMSEDIVAYDNIFSSGVRCFFIGKFTNNIYGDGCYFICMICRALTNKQYRYMIQFLKKNLINMMISLKNIITVEILLKTINLFVLFLLRQYY